MKEKKQSNNLLKTIQIKEKRKLFAQKHKNNWIFWIGFSTFGLIGWSVIVPTVLGLALGIWIDHKISSRFSWTLVLGLGGLLLGCLSAWIWITKERKTIEKEKNDRK
jgi:ATP synthase protein I